MQITSAVPAYNSPDHFQVGEAVTLSGFAGNISRHYCEGMWEVRLDRGVVCVSGTDIKRASTAA